MKAILEQMDQWFQNKSREMGLDFFPIQWEVVPEEVLLEVMASGLPISYSHWTRGQAYFYQKMQGEMGLSKVYELILNSNPSYAFLLETNSDIANIMVIAHCYGHSTFFKKNYLFQDTDRKMVYRAQRVDDYIAQYGVEKVEHILDIALAMDKNINWNLGASRKLYPAKQKIFKEKLVGEFEDLYNSKPGGYEEVVLNQNFPPQKEYDLLWFLANYADLEPWVKDIFEIVRGEAYYFYPQGLTKIINEGFASYMHAELMYLLSNEMLSQAEYLEFVKIHERVVQPGASKLDINPYFLGFTILNDIKKRWDQKFQDQESELTGFQKILKVITEEDDISFLRNYLTQEVADQLQMFVYKTVLDRNSNQFIEIESRDVKDIIETQVRHLYNNRAPAIYIDKATSTGLELVHESTEFGTLDPKHLERVMAYLHEIWGGVINLKTIDDQGEEIHYTFDEAGWSA